jgi:hypothetical protein
VGRDFAGERVVGLGFGVILIDFASVEETLAGSSQLLMGFTTLDGGLKGRDGWRVAAERRRNIFFHYTEV